jgi:hypothetical protein
MDANEYRNQINQLIDIAVEDPKALLTLRLVIDSFMFQHEQLLREIELLREGMNPNNTATEEAPKVSVRTTSLRERIRQENLKAEQNYRDYKNNLGWHDRTSTAVFSDGLSFWSHWAGQKWISSALADTRTYTSVVTAVGMGKLGWRIIQYRKPIGDYPGRDHAVSTPDSLCPIIGRRRSDVWYLVWHYIYKVASGLKIYDCWVFLVFKDNPIGY